MSKSQKIGSCTTCKSSDIVYNGKTKGGQQKFYCKRCGSYRTLFTTEYYTEERKEEILRAYYERVSLRGLTRIYGVALSTVLRWVKKNQNR